MWAAVILFLVPVLLFVIAFLYETFLSVKRIARPKSNSYGYLSATWEVTHTLLVFAVVMLLMMFTKNIDGLSTAIFTSTFIAALALAVRAACYVYIFYVRKKPAIGAVDYVFTASHLVAAVFLVITVLEALWYLYKHNPPVNTQFLPFFIPGLILVLAVCAVPLLVLYKTRD